LKRYPQDEIGKRALRDAYAALGKQRIEQGKKEEGVSYLEKARATKSSGSADLDGTVQAARKDLAQDYYEQGLRVQRTDLEAAIRLWERALEYDPGHAQAKLRLAQGRRMQQSLQSLPNSKP
jgi:tetratricopeptide (TPR) repeat protein